MVTGSRRKLGSMAFSLFSPVKQFWGDSDCAVHIAITQAALDILRQNGHQAEYDWFYNEWDAIRRGLVWADAGFKSASHFFFPYGGRNGLRGQHNGLHMAGVYYQNAQKLAAMGQKRIAAFYFGAVLHIIQDASVPQHATLKLMNKHQAFEKFVREKYASLPEPMQAKPVRFDELREFIHFNARIALKAHRLFERISDEQLRFMHIMQCIVPVAQRTSAGALLWFYQTEINRRTES